MNVIKQTWRAFKIVRRTGGIRGAMALAKNGPKYLGLYARLFRDAQVPIWAKAMVVAGVIFAVSPLNIPQYIPVLGQLDDLGLILFVGNLFYRQAPPDVLAAHRQAVGLDPRYAGVSSSQ